MVWFPVSPPPYRVSGKSGRMGTHPKNPETGRVGMAGSPVDIGLQRIMVAVSYRAMRDSAATVVTMPMMSSL